MRGRANGPWDKEAARIASNLRRNNKLKEHGVADDDLLKSADVVALLETQGYRCAVTGVDLEPNPVGGAQPFQPSLDRIDNDEGYVLGNVRIVALIVNYAMSRWGEEPLRTLLRTANG